jgi:hypothetical protein
MILREAVVRLAEVATVAVVQEARAALVVRAETGTAAAVSKLNI